MNKRTSTELQDFKPNCAFESAILRSQLVKQGWKIIAFKLGAPHHFTAQAPNCDSPAE